jgi:hypothetical protein
LKQKYSKLHKQAAQTSCTNKLHKQAAQASCTSKAVVEIYWKNRYEKKKRRFNSTQPILTEL